MIIIIHLFIFKHCLHDKNCLHQFSETFIVCLRVFVSMTVALLWTHLKVLQHAELQMKLLQARGFLQTTSHNSFGDESVGLVLVSDLPDIIRLLSKKWKSSAKSRLVTTKHIMRKTIQTLRPIRIRKVFTMLFNNSLLIFLNLIIKFDAEYQSSVQKRSVHKQCKQKPMVL